MQKNLAADMYDVIPRPRPNDPPDRQVLLLEKETYTIFFKYLFDNKRVDEF